MFDKRSLALFLSYFSFFGQQYNRQTSITTNRFICVRLLTERGLLFEPDNLYQQLHVSGGWLLYFGTSRLQRRPVRGERLRSFSAEAGTNSRSDAG